MEKYYTYISYPVFLKRPEMLVFGKCTRTLFGGSDLALDGVRWVCILGKGRGQDEALSRRTQSQNIFFS